MYITGYRRTKSIDFGECRMHILIFLQEKKMNSFTLQYMESIFSKCCSIQTAYSVELKFTMNVIYQCPTYFADLGEFRNNSFFYRSTKIFLKHYSQWSQIKRHIPVSKSYLWEIGRISRYN